MLYSLTDKLNFEDNPQIEICGKLLTVKSDATTVLKLMDIVSNKGEVEGALEAVNLLFSAKDRKAIDELKLSMQNYVALVSTAIQLAVGEDPDAESGE
jgi:hypothetical protein